MSTDTFGVASAFMTTSVQLPLRRSVTICWVPAPSADATQKSWSPGSAGVNVPGMSRYCTREGESETLGHERAMNVREVAVDVIHVGDADEDLLRGSAEVAAILTLPRSKGRRSAVTWSPAMSTGSEVSA